MNVQKVNLDDLKIQPFWKQLNIREIITGAKIDIFPAG